MSLFRVRLRLPSSKQETLSLPGPVTIRSLLEGIQPFVDTDLAQIRLRLVYPPKALDLGDPSEWDRNVKAIGINNGEGIVVRIATESSEQTVEISEPATSQPVFMEPAKQSPPDSKPEQISFGKTKLERPISPVKPASSEKRKQRPFSQEEPPEIPVEGGYIVLRVMKDDNSCMYYSLKCY